MFVSTTDPDISIHIIVLLNSFVVSKLHNFWDCESCHVLNQYMALYETPFVVPLICKVDVDVHACPIVHLVCRHRQQV